MTQVANAVCIAWVLLASARIEHAGVLLLCHTGFALLLRAIAAADTGAAPRSLVSVAHSWLPAAFVLALYFELSVLIPSPAGSEDYRYDQFLQGIDRRLFGNPVQLVEAYGSRALSELLTVAYLAYYPMTIAMPLVLYVRGAREAFQEASATIVAGFLLTFIGYALVPTLGPHRLFDGARPAVLDGFGFARTVYDLLSAVRREPPDAFPSGHTVVAILAPALAYRWYRPALAVLAPWSVGIVLATVYLRFHYVADVLAGVLVAALASRLVMALSDPKVGER